MENTLFVEMLGGLRVRITDPAGQNERVVTRFRTRATGALFAYLALYPAKSHSREKLIELFWPDQPPQTGRNNLSLALSALRRSLEPDGAVIVSDRHTVQLAPGAAQTDVAHFDAAVRAGDDAAAINWYRSELLEGFYDDWILVERDRLAAVFERLQTNPVYDEAVATPPTVLPARAQAMPTAPNLPTRLTRFFGRDAEIATVCRWIQEGGERLITLCGTGGVGKTRLALEIAASLCETFENAIWFVSLAAITSADQIPATVSAKLRASGADASDGLPLIEQIAAHLNRFPRTLLVLDNMEQFVTTEGGGDLAGFIESLLTRVPGLQCVTTSRVRLPIPGEKAWQVEPLPAPAGVRLFVDRAQSARSDFSVSESNLVTVGAICEHLDGLPLALELAAAWAGSLTPAQTLLRLSKTRFGLLKARRDSGVVSRHRSLRLALDSSYDLLPPTIQRFFNSLAIFRGGWTLEACEAVLGEPLALEYLSYLRDASLILTQETPSGMRFGLLETMREYAGERNGETQAALAPPLAKPHAGYYADFASDAAHIGEGFLRFDADADNLRAALEWSLEHAPHTALRLAAALGAFWEQRGDTQAGRRYLAPVCKRSFDGVETVHLRSIVAGSLGKLCFLEGDFATAESYLQTALTLGRQCGDADSIATALSHLGIVASYRSDLAVADAALREAMTLYRGLNDRRKMVVTLNTWGIVAACTRDYAVSGARWQEACDLARAIGDRTQEANALCYLGESATFQGDLNAAERFYTDALVLTREMGNFMEVYGLTGLGRLANARAMPEVAMRYARESLPVVRRIRVAWGIPFVLDICLCALSHTGEYEAAAQLAGFAEAERERIGAPLPVPYVDLYRPQYDAARAGLGSDRYDALCEQGRTLTIPQAFALAGIEY